MSKGTQNQIQKMVSCRRTGGSTVYKYNYVIIENEEIENIKLKTTNTVETKEFINSEEFDPLFIEKNYYVGPDTGK
jgi:DNA end-binding protein Ku